ncbi:class F sortase [Patescibacteria group bacterium]|nr:MAG: class F sortase [Patescibacteria group bacterium]
MRKKKKAAHRRHIKTLGISVAAIAVFGVPSWYVLGFDASPVQSTAAPAAVEPVPIIAAAAVENIGLPERIMIPSIAVDAAVEKVAVAADGSMDVPKDPLNTAWYELGPHPGERGSAAIAGHVNWWGGETGAFANLHKLMPGDTVTVQDDTGAVISFVVRELRILDAAADATEVFTSDDKKAHLNLITCIGAWDKRAKQYAKRLVVFTDRVIE